MPQTPVRVVVREQDLAAPHRPVVAVSRAVECDADDRPAAVEAMLGHDRGDMGVMVLHADDRAVVRVPLGPLSGSVAGVPVRRQKPGLHTGDRLQLPFSAREGVLGLKVVHVSDVRGQPGLPAFAEAERVLEVSPTASEGPTDTGRETGSGA